MEDHRKATLDETASPLTRLRTLILLVGGMLVLIPLAIAETDAVLRALYLIWGGALLLLMPLVLLLGRRRRCVMTSTGMTLDGQYLPWSVLRTAAVIRVGNVPPILCRFPDERHFILLSVKPPEEAINPQRFRMETARHGRELRVPYTRRRAKAIEHYLHMTLPEYKL